MYCPSKSFSLQLELILSQMSIKVTIVLYLVSHIFLLYLNFTNMKGSRYSAATAAQQQPPSPAQQHCLAWLPQSFTLSLLSRQ